MTPSEVRKLNETNYEFIKALNLIASELLHNGEIISDIRMSKEECCLIVKMIIFITTCIF